MAAVGSQVPLPVHQEVCLVPHLFTGFGLRYPCLFCSGLGIGEIDCFVRAFQGVAGCRDLFAVYCLGWFGC